MDLEAKYSRKQASDLTGLPVATLQYLEIYKVVQPKRPKPESGKKSAGVALYTAKDLENLELISRVRGILTSNGMKRAIELGVLPKVVEAIGDD